MYTESNPTIEAEGILAGGSAQGQVFQGSTWGNTLPHRSESRINLHSIPSEKDSDEEFHFIDNRD